MAKKQWGSVGGSTAASPKLPTFLQWLKANPATERTEFQIFQIFKPAQFDNWTLCTEAFRCSIKAGNPMFDQLAQAIADWSTTKTPAFIEVNYRSREWTIYTDDELTASWRAEPYGHACAAAFKPSKRSSRVSQTTPTAFADAIADATTDAAADAAANAHRQV